MRAPKKAPDPKSGPVKVKLEVQVDNRRTSLSIAKIDHDHATQQFDDALDALEKARKARNKAAAALLLAQEACVTP